MPKFNIFIVDNNDFKVDTMTGKSSGAHRTNVMCVQHQEDDKMTNEKSPANTLTKKELSRKLEQKCAELSHINSTDALQDSQVNHQLVQESYHQSMAQYQTLCYTYTILCR